MVVTGKIEAVRNFCRGEKRKGRRVGFIPTLGALHAGHLSLVRKARQECGAVAVSVFVNPLQFGPREDYRAYPRDLAQDTALLRKEKVDLLFCPSVKEMYRPNYSVRVIETDLSRFLCGKSRPGHFQGVGTVLVKLFNIIEPDIVYFGQKDYQQTQIVRRLVRDLNFGLTLKALPVVRERGGLALSSRNAYLDPEGRKEAQRLYAALVLARRLIGEGMREPQLIRKRMEKILRSGGPVKIDYLKIADPATLTEVKKIRKGKVLVALAVYVRGVRLIDSRVIKVS